jgi:hypothetical protein
VSDLDDTPLDDLESADLDEAEAWLDGSIHAETIDGYSLKPDAHYGWHCAVWRGPVRHSFAAPVATVAVKMALRQLQELVPEAC